jgi:D-alanyl-D-alanine carboxypeptidase
MRRKGRARKTAILILLLAAVGLAALGVFGMSRLDRLQERRRLHLQELEQARASAARLLEAFRALQLRHPDLDPGIAGQRIQAVASASPERQLREVAEAEQAFTDLELGLLERFTGLGPQDELWTQARGYWSFSAAGFKNLSDQASFPDGQAITAAPVVTGQEAADRRIVALAESRGYRLRWQVDEAALAPAGSQRLHPQALAAWQHLQAAATAEGVHLDLVSGYRSVGRQRAIFLSELRSAGEVRLGRPYRPEEIAAGTADAAILEILKYSAIPGYSKHHSGCAMDLSDPSSGLDFTEFARSSAYDWLSRHNYLNAKRFGFIPSYPPGAPAQGPDPEPWEYIWVGEEPLRRLPPLGASR